MVREAGGLEVVGGHTVAFQSAKVPVGGKVAVGLVLEEGLAFRGPEDEGVEAVGACLDIVDVAVVGEVVRLGGVYRPVGVIGVADVDGQILRGVVGLRPEVLHDEAGCGGVQNLD